MKNPFDKRGKTQKTESPPRPEKSQAELRDTLKKRFLGMKETIRDATAEYEQALAEESFEDKEGEPEGSGEKRRESVQAKMNALLERAEGMKAKLDSNEELPNFIDPLTAKYTREDGKVENITLSLESKLGEFTSFYQKNNIDLPPDFEEAIKEIWDRNAEEITKSIEENGFDDVLLMPQDLSLPDLHQKTTQGYKPTYESDNFKAGGSFALAKSQNTDKPRIVLVHKTQNLEDREELKKTLNIKGEDLKFDLILTLEDYLIFQRKYFEETGKHLDEKGWTWLATKSGARFVNAHWTPGLGQLVVAADAPGSRAPDLGARPARSFF